MKMDDFFISIFGFQISLRRTKIRDNRQIDWFILRICWDFFRGLLV
jgi:hypothetical protein